MKYYDKIDATTIHDPDTSNFEHRANNQRIIKYRPRGEAPDFAAASLPIRFGANFLFRDGSGQGRPVWNVSQLATWPDLSPVMNQRVRRSNEPWVKASGTT
jgi:hypothetical protein